MENDVPYELLIAIGLSLSLRDLLNLCEASRSMYILCQDDLFWKEKYFVDFNNYDVEEGEVVESWKQRYINTYYFDGSSRR